MERAAQRRRGGAKSGTARALIRSMRSSGAKGGVDTHAQLPQLRCVGSALLAAEWKLYRGAATLPKLCRNHWQTSPRIARSRDPHCSLSS
jgi:hypothetical protein